MSFIKSLAAALVLAGATSGAIAADLPGRTAAQAPYYVAVPDFTWTGFYLGLNGGYAFKAATTYVVPGFGSAYSQDAQGFTGGVHAGFNQQFGSLVVGLEGSASIGDINKSEAITGAPGVTGTTKITQVYTVTPRLGFAFFDRLLIYAKAGYAGALVKSTATDSVYTWSDGEFHHGWTVGAGAEYAFTNHWTAGLEYNYMRLSDVGHTGSFAGAPLTVNAQPNIHQARINLNYKF